MHASHLGVMFNKSGAMHIANSELQLQRNPNIVCKLALLGNCLALHFLAAHTSSPFLGHA